MSDKIKRRLASMRALRTSIEKGDKPLSKIKVPRSKLMLMIKDDSETIPASMHVNDPSIKIRYATSNDIQEEEDPMKLEMIYKNTLVDDELEYHQLPKYSLSLVTEDPVVVVPINIEDENDDHHQQNNYDIINNFLLINTCSMVMLL